MIPKVNRLPFVRLSSPSTIRTSHLLIKYIQLSTGPSQFAFVVSKKRVRTAVRRNAIRRELAQIVQYILPHLTRPLAIVFIYTGSTERTPLKNEVVQTFEKKRFF